MAEAAFNTLDPKVTASYQEAMEFDGLTCCAGVKQLPC